MKNGHEESGKRQFAVKKAYEISYAVFRVASRIGNVAFKEHLERQALSLLDAAAVENYAWVSMVSRAIEYLVRFGNDVGLVHESNKDVIVEELRSMAFGIAGSEKPASAEPVPLDDIFSGQEPLFRNGHISSARIPAMSPAKFVVNESGNESGNETGNTINAEVRQAAILQKIKQSGNCRLRDLQEVLPDYSERTLRYDLQTLTERNLVERVGSGGPAVFYRLRQAA